VRGVKQITCDISNTEEFEKSLGTLEFDVVVNWIAFKPEDVERDIRMFKGRANQYIFISSASAYEKPVRKLPITEDTPLDNPFWQYARDKIACERRLVQAFEEEDFPMTIIRPSYTYDRTVVPVRGGYTMLARMLQGKKAVVPGDGTSLWVLTHSRDFAGGFAGLLGNAKAVGEAFHITSDELLTWNRIYSMLAEAAGVNPDFTYVPSATIAKYDPEWGASQLGDKSHSVIFDNSKIRRFVPEYKADISFSEGAREIIEWYDDPANQAIDERYDAILDKLVKKQGGQPYS
jgi:nucleoside-diphosphate-sugar epimerase